MIELTRGDILRAEAEALVNSVNCVGVMGRGIALQFRKAFPENFRAYKAVCDKGELRPGMMLVHDLGRLTNPHYIINFPTKRHWRGNSRMGDIDSGLEALVEEIRQRRIHSVAIPPLGTGLGGLDWPQVRVKIEQAFSELTDVQVLLFQPTGAPDAKEMVKVEREPDMTVARAALLALIRRYLIPAMDPSVSLLEIHKLMYFLQETDVNLQLRYQKAPLGPYAENLRHMMSAIEGYFISGYGDAENRPDKQIEVLPGIWDRAEDFLKSHPETRARFDRVVRLIQGFETPFGMELLSTVHWVATRENASTAVEAIAKTHQWSPRKSMFTHEQIRMAYDVLWRQGWIAQE